MLSHYDSPASSGDPQRDELTRRIFLEIQRRLPGLLNRKITNYISSRNTVHDVVENDVVNDVYEDRYQDDYSEERQESEDFYENYDYNKKANSRLDRDIELGKFYPGSCLSYDS